MTNFQEFMMKYIFGNEPITADVVKRYSHQDGGLSETDMGLIIERLEYFRDINPKSYQALLRILNAWIQWTDWAKWAIFMMPEQNKNQLVDLATTETDPYNLHMLWLLIEVAEPNTPVSLELLMNLVDKIPGYFKLLYDYWDTLSVDEWLAFEKNQDKYRKKYPEGFRQLAFHIDGCLDNANQFRRGIKKLKLKTLIKKKHEMDLNAFMKNSGLEIC